MTEAQRAIDPEARPIATASFPLTEDRKSPVVLTDVSRGLMDEETAKRACRGEGHPDLRTDTPAQSDASVGALAPASEQAKREAKDKPAPTGELDPKTSGEAAARTLDPVIKENEEKGAERLAAAREERDGAEGSGGIVTAADQQAEEGSFEEQGGKPPAPVGNK